MKLPGAHKRGITGLVYSGSTQLLSCGVDQHVRLWDSQVGYDLNGMDVDEEGEGIAPVSVLFLSFHDLWPIILPLDENTSCCLSWDCTIQVRPSLLRFLAARG